ncbi:MAG: hypothetical protein ACT4P1_00535 [Sporichthyaceae bacterium]
MSEEPLAQFLCRIDGRAGHLRIHEDCVVLARSAWRGAEVVTEVSLSSVLSVAAGDPGRLFTPLHITTTDGVHELGLPAGEAERAEQVLLALVLEPVLRGWGDPGEPVEPLPPIPHLHPVGAGAVIPGQSARTEELSADGFAVGTVAGLPGPALPAEAADKLERLALLKFSGVLSDGEYDELKAELLAAD